MKPWISFASIGLALLSSACATRKPAPEIDHADPQGQSETVAPGDAVRIEVWREADLSGTFIVDDRGVVTLPLIGEREVLGIDPRTLRETLLSEYRRYLQNPSVEVTLLRRINILGEVRSPGLYPVDATISLSDAIALAGGITPSGDANKIQLIRGEQTIVQNLDEAAMIGPGLIRSGDQIVVGERSWLSRNAGVVLGSAIAAAAIITAALISN